MAPPPLHHHHHHHSSSMKTRTTAFSLSLLLFLALLLHPLPSRSQNLSSSQSKTLLRLQQLLEYPPSLSTWNSSSTSFCSLPPTPSLSLSCSGPRVTALLISGNKPRLVGSRRSTLSPNFSIDSLFTTLSRLPSLTNLSLVSLGLWGDLTPKVYRLPALRSLNLSSNYITGQIPPEVSRLGSLEKLDLSSNLFRGVVPEGIRGMARLQVLDLSDNHLSGGVPTFLFSLPSIRDVGLAGNALTGAVPADGVACGGNLTVVDLSRNKLVGKLPGCIRSSTSRVVVMDFGNCLLEAREKQNPSSYCNEQPLAAMPTGKKGEIGGGAGGSKSKLGVVLGVVGGVVGGVMVLMGLVVVLRRKKSRRGGGLDGPAVAAKLWVKKSPVHLSSGFPADARYVGQEARLGMLGVVPYRVFDIEELEEMTNNFDPSNLVEESTQEELYRGWLLDGSAVMIRCLKLKQKCSARSLHQFVDAISKLQHCNLVSILGHSIIATRDNSNTSSAIYLVFEQVSNGTLRSHLTEWRKREMFKWPQRVNAAIGVARGIQFLHTVTVPGIYGNDLNIDNILMDETLTTKINNYNLPVLPKTKSSKVGVDTTFSVLEGKESSSISSQGVGDKEDIYQLGLILTEVITGKPAKVQSDLEHLTFQLQKILAESPIELRPLVDPAIYGTFAYESLKTVVEVTLNCLSKDPSRRPSIDDIIWNLQYSVQVQFACASSDNLSVQSFRGA